MKRRKLKSFVIPSTIALFIIGTLFTTSIISKKASDKEPQNLTYVSKAIIEDDVAVINTDKKVIYPYTDQSVEIGKYFYDYKGESSKQEKSIIYHDNTYMQNSGVDFISANVFDVISVLDGTVTDVKEDENLGKIVEIKHGNDCISIYQSLSELSVKKGDTVNQGQIIGKSGTNELDKEMGNHLHFEFYTNGQVVDPTLYLGKELAKTGE